MSNIRYGIFAATILAAAAFAPAAEADGAGAIKYRQAVMKAVGGHMGAMATILKGGGPMADFKGHAHAMAELAKIAENIFPEDSSPMEGTTAAKMDIWDKPAEFKAVIMTFKEKAKALVKAAESGDKGKIGGAMGALGKGACKECHTNFREKK